MNYNKPEYSFIKKIKRIQNPPTGRNCPFNSDIFYFLY